MRMKQGLLKDLELLWDRELKRMYQSELKFPRKSSLITNHLSNQDADKRAVILDWLYQTQLSKYLVQRQKMWRENKLAEVEIRKVQMQKQVLENLKDAEATMTLMGK